MGKPADAGRILWDVTDWLERQISFFSEGIDCIRISSRQPLSTPKSYSIYLLHGYMWRVSFDGMRCELATQFRMHQMDAGAEDGLGRMRVSKHMGSSFQQQDANIGQSWLFDRGITCL
jgi:hypothetical protein